MLSTQVYNLAPTITLSNEKLQHTDKVAAILNMLDNADEQSHRNKQKKCKRFY